VSTAHFNGQHKTVFIVHGFHGEENDNWISLMTSALLKDVVFMLCIGIQLFNIAIPFTTIFKAWVTFELGLIKLA
jgi:hypothetical protein